MSILSEGSAAANRLAVTHAVVPPESKSVSFRGRLVPRSRNIPPAKMISNSGVRVDIGKRMGGVVR